VLVANGDTDVMVPSINSVELARKLPHSQLSIFPDSGHGAIFQYHSAFLDQTVRFLQKLTLIRHCRFTGTGADHQMATRGHDLEYGGTKEVLVVESPHPDDAVVQWSSSAARRWAGFSA